LKLYEAGTSRFPGIFSMKEGRMEGNFNLWLSFFQAGNLIWRGIAGWWRESAHIIKQWWWCCC
jgi:hypothetical protein